MNIISVGDSEQVNNILCWGIRAGHHNNIMLGDSSRSSQQYHVGGFEPVIIKISCRGIQSGHHNNIVTGDSSRSSLQYHVDGGFEQVIIIISCRGIRAGHHNNIMLGNASKRHQAGHYIFINSGNPNPLNKSASSPPLHPHPLCPPPGQIYRRLLTHHQPQSLLQTHLQLYVSLPTIIQIKPDIWTFLSLRQDKIFSFETGDEM